MKKFLLETINKSPMSFTSTKKIYLALVLSIIGFAVDAQCIGPYARFESIGSSAANTTGFTFTTAGVGSTAGVARSGKYYYNDGTLNAALTTPVIDNPSSFSFYVKCSNTLATYAVEYSLNGGSTFADATTVSGVTYTKPAVSTSWQLVTFTFGTPFNSNNVKFRVRDTYTRGTASTLYVDDVFWKCYVSGTGAASTGYPENPMVAPVQINDGTPSSCAGGTVIVDPTAVYNFYDNGGPSDEYNLSQTHTVTFTPSATGYTAGDRVRIQFVNYVAGDTGDMIEVWDDNGTSALPKKLLTWNGTTAPTNPTYISTVSADGSITIKYTTNATAGTTPTGFNIKVDCVRCPTPTGLATSVVNSNDATVTWNTTTAGAYDVYYSTTNANPPTSYTLGNVTPQGLNLATNSYTLTGLATGATYYVWVRSRCGSSPDSYSPWSPVLSFTTTNCAAFVIATSPSSTPQNLCLNASATPLTASATGGTVSTYQWYSNTTATTTGGTAVGTNSNTYTPVTSVAGTLYYYCVITSTTPCTATTLVSGAVTVTAPPASAPVASAATAVTASSFSANWAAVSGATGYYLDVATDSGFTAFVTGYNNLNVSNVLTYSVTSLNSGTTYYYRVRAYNSCGTTVSSNTITQATTGITYCTPTYSFGDSLNDQITNVTLGTLNNSSGISPSPYYTFYNAVTVPNLYQGATVPVSVSFGSDGNQYAAVWIDFNKNGTFETTEGFVSLTNAGSNGTTTINVAVPAGALLGNTRMRVRGGDDSALTTTMACGASNSSFGETEDYIVNIISVPPCAVSTPSSLTFANVNATTATLIWSDPSMTPNTVYNYYVSTVNSAPPADGSDPSGMGTVTGALSANISGLTVGNTYYFWVRTKCDATHYSAWIPCSTSFTTAALDIIAMTNGSVTTCNAKFYDSGNLLSNYTNNESYIYTFSPASGTNLKVVFNSFQVENNFDFLTIYDGPNTSSPSLGTFTGTQIAAGQAFYSSAANGGSLTFKFTSDFTVTASGWNADITCVTVPTITSFSPTNTCAGTTPLITVNGTNFTTTPTVTYNGTTVPTVSATNTQITFNLPSGATTGLIKVSTAQASITSSSSFIVKPVPTTPNAGADVTICSGQSTNLVATSTPAAGSLTTTLIGGNGCTGGNMFDIVTGGSPITINAFDITPNNGGVQNVNVYYKVGTYVGSETNSAAWTLLGTYSVNGVAKTLINMPTGNIAIPAGSTYGIYINYDAVYTTGTGNYSNPDITINAGAGLCGSFSSVNTPRIFNGRVYYQLSLPLTYSWTPSTGLSNAAIYNPVASPTSTQTYLVSTTYNGCTSATDNVVVTVNATPTITASASTPALCYSATSQTALLSYSATTGSPTSYSITWNASPANSFVAVTNAALTSSPINISVPAGTAGGTYTGNLTVKNGSCTSTVSTFTITVSPQLSIASSSNATAVCGGVSSTVLPFSGTTGSPVSYSITWNASPANTFVAVTDVANTFTGTTLPIAIPAGTAAGTYTGNITVKNAVGCVSASVPFNLTISQQPTVTLAASASPVCFSSSAQTTTLSYSSPVGSPTIYTLTWSGAAPAAGFTNLGNTALPPVIGTAPITINVPANAAAGTYNGAIVIKNAGACASSSLPFTVKINGKPTITSGLLLDPLCVSSGAQIASMGYSATTNAPTSYSIDWNAAANTAGLLDQGLTTYPFINGDDSINNIVISPNVPANQYTGTLTLTNANGCTNNYTVTLYIGKRWNGITSSDWATASNWTPSGEPTSGDYCVVIPSGTPNSAVISSAAFTGDLTIYSGATVTINSGVALEVQDFVQTDGTLIVNNNASLVQINDVPNSGTGNMIYKRDVNALHGYDYVYWSSPVNSQPINGLYSTPPIGYKYYWDTLVNNGNGTGGNVSQGNWAVASGNMSVGKGYIIRGSTSYGWSGNLTSIFTGIPNNGTIAVPIARGSYQGAMPYIGINGIPIANTDDNMNLIGNPYPSAIKATDFLTANTNIDGAVYLWTHNTSPSSVSNPFYSSYTTNYFTSDYITYNSAGVSSGPGTFNGYIAAGQGFFVAMSNGPQDATQSVTFTNAMRSQAYSNSQFYKNGQSMVAVENDKHRIWIDLIDSTNNSTRTLVAYCAGATNQKDRNFDAYTKISNANIIYSLVNGESEIIQGRALPFDTNDQVSLGFHAETTGTFTIAIHAVDGLFEQGQSIYLQDNLLGIVYDLRSAPYVFTSTSGTFNDRFVLRYTNGSLSSNQIGPKNTLSAVISDSKLEIKASQNIIAVHVYDVSGKLVKVYNPSLKSDQFKEDFLFEKGIYFAKIKLEDGSLTTEKLMN